MRLDTDWYESTRHELEHLYPRLVPGGVLIIDDYGHGRARAAPSTSISPRPAPKSSSTASTRAAASASSPEARTQALVRTSTTRCCSSSVSWAEEGRQMPVACRSSATGVSGPPAYGARLLSGVKNGRAWIPRPLSARTAGAVPPAPLRVDEDRHEPAVVRAHGASVQNRRSAAPSSASAYRGGDRAGGRPGARRAARAGRARRRR